MYAARTIYKFTMPPYEHLLRTLYNIVPAIYWLTGKKIVEFMDAKIIQIELNSM